MDAAMLEAGFTTDAKAEAEDLSSIDYAGHGYTVNVTVYGVDGLTNLMVNASRDA